ncbi:conserved hypothetical protein (plasmid) [Borreliella garinii PBr]|uniref:Uncharacterized protein n=1 Tax=Borreliella garinii PBr TaxID=498743 RepID=B8F0T2_BORGR|nr:conserved hypothetical protein [Borreliella garinii PBr]ACL34607.1 conserved hypothetical protein [Borreliella garinii PBr]
MIIMTDLKLIPTLNLCFRNHQNNICVYIVLSISSYIHCIFPDNETALSIKRTRVLGTLIAIGLTKL